MQVVIRIENLYKEYRLGIIGHGTIYRDLQSWWAITRGKEDPNSLIGHPGNGQIKDHILALDDVNLDIEEGEVLGIIGKNGAGKSTLLKILSRVTAPTSGIVKAKGTIASLLEVGTGFHPELTGRENIYLNGAINGMNKQEVTRKLDEIVDFSGVEQFLDTPIKRYSSGMHVRLGFAVAAHLDPDILVVDEVLAVGDASFQKKAVGKIQDVSKGQGRTVLFVSHNMTSIRNLCERVVLLEKGRIVEDGEVEYVIGRYLSSTEYSKGVKIWHDLEEAPGNEIVKLKSIGIKQDSVNEYIGDIDLNKPIHIEIEYVNLQENAPLYVALWLKDLYGANVLASSTHKNISLNNDEWFGKPHPKGLFRSECTIPARLLCGKTYYISPIIGIVPTDTQILCEDLISIDVYDSGPIDRKNLGGWFGVVAPPLKWKTEYIESGEDV